MELISGESLLGFAQLTDLSEIFAASVTFSLQTGKLWSLTKIVCLFVTHYLFPDVLASDNSDLTVIGVFED